MLVPGHRLGIVVKADGYGHGLVASAHAALLGGADLLCVATLDEGLVLRSAGLSIPILILYPVPPGRLVDANRHDLDIVVIDQQGAREVAAFAGLRSGVPRRRPLRVHLGVETGMHRGGLHPEYVAAVARLLLSSGATVVGTWSHLADAEDPAAVDAQVARFELALESLRRAGIDPGLRHLAASGGFLSERCPAYEIVRVGLAFFGVMPWSSELTRRARDVMDLLQAALSLKAEAVSVSEVAVGERVGYGGEWEAARRSLIAVLPLGYADGWTRAYWPGGVGLVRGIRVPLVGRVSSDAVAVDVTDAAPIQADDDFVLIGQQAEDMIEVSALAARRGSIVQEVLMGLAPRLPRLYTWGGDLVAARYADGELVMTPAFSARVARTSPASPRPQHEGLVG